MIQLLILLFLNLFFFNISFASEVQIFQCEGVGQIRADLKEIKDYSLDNFKITRFNDEVTILNDNGTDHWTMQFGTLKIYDDKNGKFFARNNYCDLKGHYNYTSISCNFGCCTKNIIMFGKCVLK